MQSNTISVHWHDECQPIYSLHFQPGEKRALRLVTAGGDNNVRVWRLKYPSPNGPLEPTVEYLCTLRKHTQAVNAVRFDPTGKKLATASDDGLLIVWTLSPEVVVEFGHQDDEASESWIVSQVHNTNLEIYDISWSPDSRYLLAACMNNTSKVYDVVAGLSVCDMSSHAHYVQGAAWDPKNEFVATLSADRSMHMFSIDSVQDSVKMTLILKQSKTDQYARLVSTLDKDNIDTQVEKRPSHLYYSETLQSFFRRLAFSPDGSLLLTPLGVFKKDENESLNGANDNSSDSTYLNTVYIYIRSGLNKAPICHIPGLPKPAVAVSFNPLFYKSSGLPNAVFSLPYKMVFAVATQSSVYVYDTERLQPLGIVNNLHYLTITDICWDNDGQSLMVSSAEGFCSVVVFDEGVFGEVTSTEKISLANGDPDKAVLKEELKNDTVKSKTVLDAFIVKDKDVSPKKPINALAPKDATAPTAPIKEKQSLIGQFMASPILVKREAEPTSDGKLADGVKPEELKKRRIAPTLLQDYK